MSALAHIARHVRVFWTTEIRRNKERRKELGDYLLLFLKTSTATTRIATMNANIAVISPVRSPAVLVSTCLGGVVVEAAVEAEEGFCVGVEADAVVVGVTRGVSVTGVVGVCVGVWVGFAVGADVSAGVGVRAGVC